MLRKLIVLSYLLTTVFVNSERSNDAIDSNYLESVLDAEECDRQISLIRSNALLLLQFADAGLRFPKGVLAGSRIDLGNYHQCLGIEYNFDDLEIQGKYCSINVPLNQSIDIPDFQHAQDPWNEMSSSIFLNQERINKVEEFNLRRAQILAMSGNLGPLEKYHARSMIPSPLVTSVLTFGVCVPKPCSTQQAITSLLFNVSEIGFDYTEVYCRLPDDKPWTGAELSVVITFSIIGFATLLSTSYDLIHRFIFKTDLRTINPIYQSCSVYTNAQRLTTFSAGSETIQCIDGIRTLAMVWVILGHTFDSDQLVSNFLDLATWLLSEKSIWVTGANITVDTFFALAGVLLVYTAANKMTGTKLLKNLHWFYLDRIVRITPLLAATVLLEASFFNHLSDGPAWDRVASRTDTCRNNWWYTLLYVQNLAIPRDMCVIHAWYLAIDMHLYIVSPIIIYWVFTGKKRNAWLALISGLMAILTASTIFNFIKNLPAGMIGPYRGQATLDYMPVYYFNTLTRASPFFVGLVFGYILHLYRSTKANMSWVLAVIIWMISIGIVGGIFYFHYVMKQLDYDNQFMDNFMNSFMRPAWASVVCWLIFACVHGYAGPINWFLSLDVWRLPARLSYAMYLIHYPFMFVINGTAITPFYFTPGLQMFKFLAHFSLALIAAFILTVVIDSPVSALYKQLVIKVQPMQPREVQNEKKTRRADNSDNNLHLKEAQTVDNILDGNHETNVNTVTEK